MPRGLRIWTCLPLNLPPPSPSHLRPALPRNTSQTTQIETIPHVNATKGYHRPASTVMRFPGGNATPVVWARRATGAVSFDGRTGGNETLVGRGSSGQRLKGETNSRLYRRVLSGTLQLCAQSHLLLYTDNGSILRTRYCLQGCLRMTPPLVQCPPFRHPSPSLCGWLAGKSAEYKNRKLHERQTPCFVFVGLHGRGSACSPLVFH